MAKQESVCDSERKQERENLTEQGAYEFGKNSFIVERVFKDESGETLGAVLLRLITHEK